MHKITLVCLLTILLTSCSRPQSIMGPAPTPTVGTMELCEDGATIAVGDFVLINNIWNKGDTTGYTECIFTQAGDPAVLGWRWDWPGKDRLIKAYPEVMLGDSPWSDAVPTGSLPLPVSDEDFLVTYDAALQAFGSWNFALELWLTDALPPAEENIRYEVMFWMDAGALSPGPAARDIITVDDVTYSVHVSPNHGDASGGSGATWTYIVFYARQPQHTATLNLGEFLGYLQDEGIIEDNLYVATVELGMEIASGSGEFVLNSYEVSVP